MDEFYLRKKAIEFIKYLLDAFSHNQVENLKKNYKYNYHQRSSHSFIYLKMSLIQLINHIHDSKGRSIDYRQSDFEYINYFYNFYRDEIISIINKYYEPNIESYSAYKYWVHSYINRTIQDVLDLSNFSNSSTKPLGLYCDIYEIERDFDLYITKSNRSFSWYASDVENQRLDQDYKTKRNEAFFIDMQRCFDASLLNYSTLDNDVYTIINKINHEIRNSFDSYTFFYKGYIWEDKRFKKDWQF